MRRRTTVFAMLSVWLSANAHAQEMPDIAKLVGCWKGGDSSMNSEFWRDRNSLVGAWSRGVLTSPDHIFTSFQLDKQADVWTLCFSDTSLDDTRCLPAYYNAAPVDDNRAVFQQSGDQLALTIIEKGRTLPVFNGKRERCWYTQ
jgi:hypothetical protein